MILDFMILDGWKTYGGRVVVKGFDSEFNAIVGKNGHGKSNMLDGICFVLGISKSEDMRAPSADDLIYRHGGVTKATVTLVFDNSDPSNGPLGFEDCAQITVSRQVTKGGRSQQYKINGSTVTLTRVINMFHSVQLNVNNPNFLIMQGRIAKVVDMKPHETSAMIAEAAGTKFYENKERTSVKTIAQKDTKLIEIERVMTEDIRPRIKRLEEQKQQYVEFTKLEQRAVDAEEVMIAHQFWLASKKAEEVKEQRAVDVEEKGAIDERKKGAAKEVKELETKIRETREQRTKDGGAQMTIVKEAESVASQKLVAARTDHKELKRRGGDDAKELKEALKAIEDLKKSQAQAAGGWDEVSANEAAAKAKVDEAEATAQRAQAALDAAIGLGGSGADAGGAQDLPGQLNGAKEALRNLATESKVQESRKKEAEKQLKETEAQLAKARKEGGKQEDQHAALAAEVARLRKGLEELTGPEASADAEARLSVEVREAQAELRRRESEECALAGSLAASDFKLPSAAFAGRVQGTVATNLRVREERHMIAIEALAGSRLNQVIVDNDETADQLLRQGLQRRVTFIPQNRVRKSAQEEASLTSRVQQAQALVGEARAFRALDLLEYDQAVHPAMLYVFGSMIVCSDRDAARKVCDELNLKTVTLEGDLFDPSGTLTGGSRKPSGESLLNRLGQLHTLRETIGGLRKQIQGKEQLLHGLSKAAEQSQQHRQQLEVAQARLDVLEQTRQASPIGRLEESAARLCRQRDEALEALARLAHEMRTREQERDNLQTQIDDLAGNRDKVVAERKAAAAAAKKAAQAAHKAYSKVNETAQSARAQLEAAEADMAAAVRRLDEAKEQQAATSGAIIEAAAAEAERFAEYEAARAELESCQKALGTYDTRVQELESRIRELAEQREKDEAELVAIAHRVDKLGREQKEAEKEAKELKAKHSFIGEHEKHFGDAGGKYDFSKVKTMQKDRERLQAQLKKDAEQINKKVLAMYEKAQEEYADLVAKREQVQKDKESLQGTIDHLAQMKKEQVQRTYEQVNEDFKAIFHTLMPSAHAKLATIEGLTVEEGLQIQAGFGGVWKKGLTELSGGQKTLVALSLVLALLKVKPAPLYILDEVDAALDGSNTQNVGKMIKQHFSQAQFLIVSHKNGMFDNANVVFRVELDEITCKSSVLRKMPVLGLPEVSAATEPPRRAAGAAATGVASRAPGAKKMAASAASGRAVLGVKN